MKDIQLPIHYNTDVISYQEALVNYYAVKKELLHPLDGMTLTAENYATFIAILSEKYIMQEYDFSETQRTLHKHLVHDDFILYVSGSNKTHYVQAVCRTLDISEEIFSIYRKYRLSDDEITISMTSFFHIGAHISQSERVLAKDEINSISTSYYPYLNIDAMFQQFFTQQENILILTGKPGIGKSKMSSAILKYAADNEDLLPYDKVKDYDAEVNYVSVAYVKSTKILCDDNFWRELESQYFDFVILDDLDFFLTKRSAEVASGDDQERNQFLNQFLSFTDGLEKNRTKFIITTNQPHDDLDLALLRKGRLFDILELRSLKKNEALNIWKENALDEDEFAELFDEDRILPADLGSEISKRMNTKTIVTESYLLEEGISKIEKAKKKKKVGV